jgi:hypothetical protein
LPSSSRKKNRSGTVPVAAHQLRVDVDTVRGELRVVGGYDLAR